jgi:hypothetical protein
MKKTISYTLKFKKLWQTMLFMGLTISFPAYTQEISEFDYHEPVSEVQLPPLAKGETLNAENILRQRSMVVEPNE